MIGGFSDIKFRRPINIFLIGSGKGHTERVTDMSDVENCIELLKKIAEENSCVRRTIDGFWFSFSNYRQEEPTEYRNFFGDEDVTVKFADIVNLDDMKVSLVLRGQPHVDYHAFLTVSYAIYYKEKYIGYYTMVFSLDGEVEDDILCFY